MSSILRKIKIINPNNIKENFYCSLCNYPLITIQDFDSNSDYKTCEDCYLQFIESRKEEWKNGWRPEKTILSDYLLLKNTYNKPKRRKNI